MNVLSKIDLIQYVYSFVGILSNFLRIAIFVRIVVSWFSGGGMRRRSGVFMGFIYDVTEPVFDVARKFPHKYGMMDFSPIIALFLIDGVVYLFDLIFKSLI